ncbi:MAG TPA: ribonuclease P protein component [Rhodospirillaceae bacterium]|jgi:ribonuclease P protein component|nr:ribonuclease P protein component [Alphaproteobacteria bacterium]HBH26931.1 ribonuclease P protein component [Rhodospirillaceae bacterium]
MHATRAAQKTLVRLTTRAEFVHLNKAGRKWTARSLVVQVAPGAPGRTHLGLTVTKRVDKRAVVRNRIRRRLRAAAVDTLPGRLPPGTDIVLIGRSSTLAAPYATLCADLRWCLKRLGLDAS